VILPALLRPVDFFNLDSKAFSGLDLVISCLSRVIQPLVPGVLGFFFFRAMIILERILVTTISRKNNELI
jgi:hypothetical protein